MDFSRWLATWMQRHPLKEPPMMGREYTREVVSKLAGQAQPARTSRPWWLVFPSPGYALVSAAATVVIIMALVKPPAQVAKSSALLLAEACVGIYRLVGDEYVPLDADDPVRFDDRLAAALKLSPCKNEGEILRAAFGGLDQPVVFQANTYSQFCAQPTGDRDPFGVGFPTVSSTS